MKKLLVLLLIPLLISGCKPNPNRTEITDVDFIRTIGIDKNQEDIMVSVVLKKNDASKKQGSGSGAESDSVAEVLSATAPTFWEALKNFRRKRRKRCCWTLRIFYYRGKCLSGGPSKIHRFYQPQ